MKFVSFLLIGTAAAACGGGGSKATEDAQRIDAPTVDANTIDVDAPDVTPDAPDVTGPCNPLAAPGAQGCAVGQKCTWIDIQDTPDPLGKLGCVPDGTVTLGGLCTHGAVGEATGYDNCVAGSICIGAGNSAKCQDICGFDGSANAACDPTSACTRYAGLGANGDDDPVIGACNQSCDPLTQKMLGSDATCGTNKGCYTLAGSIDTTAVCAGAGTVPNGGDIAGTTYANSCAPGNLPRQKTQGQSGNVCASYCKPADVYMGHNESYENGDPTVTNYAGLPATCESAGGPTRAAGVPVTGEECQYFWTREAATGITNFSNTLGWCFNNMSWKYDPDGMDPINNTADYPRCSTLTTGDVLPPNSTDPTMPKNDALYFGCIALPATFTEKPKSHTKYLPSGLVIPDRMGSFRQ